MWLPSIIFVTNITVNMVTGHSPYCIHKKYKVNKDIGGDDRENGTTTYNTSGINEANGEAPTDTSSLTLDRKPGLRVLYGP